ncbi:MAG: stress responsive protein [Muricauda sp.]|uniref:Stress responsive protein n=1 Tax=Flagellimonas lutaonensis TaxID=516051 RepID=A0A0D5YTY8_9FLAO|nr:MULTISPECIES: Dabb family protein [Allomuricauda]AKA35359.1 stress responsive protein [Allomuricauda lutaonensis]MAU26335.1 stress responsive protein [Allomuricauda sp.]MBC31765.1 stress responsive protein [Allomuricauda sp.]MBC32219.1 stress responsive protein [Allomuricauda sp.]|tara:strand:+ start:40046 stop:40441 length:396 start_codon:yes stop_codon:yes gene_type:complete
MKKSILTFALLLVTAITFAQSDDTVNEFDSNFAHVVYFWFNDPDDEQARERFEASLRKFLDNSKYAKTNFIGTPPKAVRDVVDDSFTYNLIVTFESAEAQEGYQKEEAHITFIEECKDLWKKVIVYDAQGI